MELYSRELESPIGPLRIAIDAQGRLHRLWFPYAGAEDDTNVANESTETAIARVAQRLARYFAGELDAIDDIAVAPQGSPLQQAVWAELRRIGPGQVTSYGALANRLGYADRRMARSIGMANAANPVALVIPCHRVIGKDGSLRGYAWGLERKRWLLAHERAGTGTTSAAAADAKPVFA